jgi:hypothetical protein
MPVRSWIHIGVHLLITADGRGPEALLHHSARAGFFFAPGAVVSTVVDRDHEIARDLDPR